MNHLSVLRSIADSACLFPVPDGFGRRGSRKRILHCNVTRHPTGLWITQKLREALPYDSQHKYLILDRDARFGATVSAAVDATRLKAVTTSFRSPRVDDFVAVKASKINNGVLLQTILGATVLQEPAQPLLHQFPYRHYKASFMPMAQEYRASPTVKYLFQLFCTLYC